VDSLVITAIASSVLTWVCMICISLQHTCCCWEHLNSLTSNISDCKWTLESALLNSSYCQPSGDCDDELQRTSGSIAGWVYGGTEESRQNLLFGIHIHMISSRTRLDWHWFSPTDTTLILYYIIDPALIIFKSTGARFFKCCWADPSERAAESIVWIVALQPVIANI